MGESSKLTWGLRLVYGIVFLDQAGFGIVLPLVPFFIKDMGGDSKIFGYFISLYAIAQAVGSVFWGKMGDKYGRKPVVLIGTLGTAAAFLTLAVADNIYVVMCARGLSGLSGGVATAASAYIAAVTEPSERSKRLGYLDGLKGVGFVMGPPIGSVLYHFLGFRLAFATPAVFALATCFGGIFLLEEPKQLPKDAPLLDADTENGKEKERRDPDLTIGKLHVCFGCCVLLTCLDYMSMSMVETVFPYILQDELGWGAKQYIWLFLSFGISVALTQGLINPVVSGAVGEIKTMVIAFGMRVITFLMVTQADLVKIPAIDIAAVLVTASGSGLLASNVGALIANIVDEIDVLKKAESQDSSEGPAYGRYMGIKDALTMGSLAVAPTIGGIIYAHFGIMVNYFGFAIVFTGMCISLNMVRTPAYECLVKAKKEDVKDEHKEPKE